MARKTNKTDHLLNLLAGGSSQEETPQGANGGNREEEKAVLETEQRETASAGADSGRDSAPEREKAKQGAPENESDTAESAGVGKNAQEEPEKQDTQPAAGAKNVHVVRAIGSEDPVAELIREELERDLNHALENGEERTGDRLDVAKAGPVQNAAQPENTLRAAEPSAAEETEPSAGETEAAEAVRMAAEEALRAEAEQVEEERRNAEEAQRKAAEEFERAEEERRTAEEAQRKAAEELARAEEERRAAEEAQRRVTEELARAEEERRAAEEAQRKAAEELARAEEERRAAKEAAGNDGMKGHVFYNMMEKIVREKAPEYMKKFGLCDCSRCTADTIALSLTMLPPKYVVVEETAISPLLSFYEDHYSGEIIVALTKACIAVNDNPRHKKQ